VLDHRLQAAALIATSIHLPSSSCLGMRRSSSAPSMSNGVKLEQGKGGRVEVPARPPPTAPNKGGPEETNDPFEHNGEPSKATGTASGSHQTHQSTTIDPK